MRNSNGDPQKRLDFLEMFDLLDVTTQQKIISAAAVSIQEQSGSRLAAADRPKADPS